MALIKEDNPQIAELLLTIQAKARLLVATPHKKRLYFPEPINSTGGKIHPWYGPALSEQFDFDAKNR